MNDKAELSIANNANDAGQCLRMRTGGALNSARSGYQPTADSVRSGAQITQFGVTLGGHLGDQVADSR